MGRKSYATFSDWRKRYRYAETIIAGISRGWKEVQIANQLQISRQAVSSQIVRWRPELGLLVRKNYLAWRLSRVRLSRHQRICKLKQRALRGKNHYCPPCLRPLRSNCRKRGLSFTLITDPVRRAKFLRTGNADTLRRLFKSHEVLINGQRGRVLYSYHAHSLSHSRTDYWVFNVYSKTLAVCQWLILLTKDNRIFFIPSQHLAGKTTDRRGRHNIEIPTGPVRKPGQPGRQPSRSVWLQYENWPAELVDQ